MSKRILYQEDQRILKHNPCVLKVSENTIIYTDEFKTHFISEYSKGNN